MRSEKKADQYANNSGKSVPNRTELAKFRFDNFNFCDRRLDCVTRLFCAKCSDRREVCSRFPSRCCRGGRRGDRLFIQFGVRRGEHRYNSCV